MVQRGTQALEWSAYEFLAAIMQKSDILVIEGGKEAAPVPRPL